MEHRYFVVANRFGRLSVAVNEDYTAHDGDVILFRSNNVDEAFEWKDGFRCGPPGLWR